MYNEKSRLGSSAKIVITSLICATAVSALTAVATVRYIRGSAGGYPDNGSSSGNGSNGNGMTDMLSATVPGGAATGGSSGQAGGNGYSVTSLSLPVAQSVAQIATDGVVGITTEKATEDDMFRQGSNEVGVGSGVIVSTDGYILTNNHVAGYESTRIIVSFADGRDAEGTVVWADPVLDLAAVKVGLTDLKPLVLGDASKLQVGENAIAIGNPMGLEFQRTVTSGIISALNRTIEVSSNGRTNYMEDLIQTDASINPGNSGGPLLNSKGEVIGINTIKVTSAEAMGFAIPVNITKPIVEKLVKTGRFDEPYMGLFAYDKNVIPYVDGDANVDCGIYIAYIDNAGPAYKAGLREGCIIRQIDGVDINTMLELRTNIYYKAPGDTINISYTVDGSDQWETTQVVLAKKVTSGSITR